MSGKINNLIRKAKADTEEKTSIASARRAFADEAEAKKEFVRFSEKLLLIECWNHASGVSSFKLFDENGVKTSDRPAAIGDFVCIKLPGTGKEDWVKIIDIYENSDEKVLTVQPTYDPTEESLDKSVTSHFFTEDSTNNFCLQLSGAIINMYVIGLNEISNTEDTNNIIESARNFATANLGHFLGVQKAEWTTFCENFLEKKN
jgi:hypothetical protein